MPVHYGQDDNENTLPILFVCVAAYIVYRWVKSIVEKPAKQTGEDIDFVVTDKKVDELEIITQMQSIEDNDTTNSELQTDKEARKLKLKGAFLSVLSSYKGAEISNESQDDEDEIA